MEARLGFKMVLSVHMNPCIDFVCEFQMLNCFILLSIWCVNFERVKRNIFGQKGKVYDISVLIFLFLTLFFLKETLVNLMALVAGLVITPMVSGNPQ